MDSLTETVAVITSELVTNALHYGGEGHKRQAFPSSSVWVGMARQGSTALCAVFDPGSTLPVVKVADHLAESGRGLHVVESLSEAWGWTPPDSMGKAVWAMVSSSAQGPRH